MNAAKLKGEEVADVRSEMRGWSYPEAAAHGHELAGAGIVCDLRCGGTFTINSASRATIVSVCVSGGVDENNPRSPARFASERKQPEAAERTLVRSTLVGTPEDWMASRARACRNAAMSAICSAVAGNAGIPLSRPSGWQQGLIWLAGISYAASSSGSTVSLPLVFLAIR